MEQEAQDDVEDRVADAETAQDDDSRFLDVIAHADRLQRLSEVEDLDVRAAIVAIHAYMYLLLRRTELPQEELKRELGCSSQAHDLLVAELPELEASRDFLGFVAEMVLVADGPAEASQSLLGISSRVYRVARRRLPLVRQALNSEFEGDLARRELSLGRLGLAEALMRLTIARDESLGYTATLNESPSDAIEEKLTRLIADLSEAV